MDNYVQLTSHFVLFQLIRLEMRMSTYLTYLECCSGSPLQKVVNTLVIQ